MVFSEEDIVKATDNFSHVNKLGTGGFGEVYKGWINGTYVAVKRLTEVQNSITLLCINYSIFI